MSILLHLGFDKLDLGLISLLNLAKDGPIASLKVVNAFVHLLQQPFVSSEVKIG